MGLHCDVHLVYLESQNSAYVYQKRIQCSCLSCLAGHQAQSPTCGEGHRGSQREMRMRRICHSSALAYLEHPDEKKMGRESFVQAYRIEKQAQSLSCEVFVARPFRLGRHLCQRAGLC